MDYEVALRTLVDWASSDTNVRAVVLTGSGAAGTEHPLSDRDVELHVLDPAPIESDDSWWNGLGEVLAVERLENGDEQPTRLIYYVGGKLDFTLVQVDVEPAVYDRPFTVLLDKDGRAADFTMEPASTPPPEQEAFDECCNWASAATLMAAKAIVRDEPWSEMTRVADLMAELLRMIEWDHAIRYRGARDVRYLGTRMRQWMDPEVQEALAAHPMVFGRSNEDALLAIFGLFEALASGVSEATDLAPFALARVRAEATHILTKYR